ncbi:hypothetical protein [Rhodococcoides fascians]|uniref:hypothetical protein n=1 Tax=Rhodococcoides fascians TaxID=1828 RepID=UPI00050CB498|nr:hypothetical protein [Rhodococcus fascians]
MSRGELAAVVGAIVLSTSGAAFAVFLAVSSLEEQIHKYFGGSPLRARVDSDVGMYGDNAGLRRASELRAVNPHGNRHR